MSGRVECSGVRSWLYWKETVRTERILDPAAALIPVCSLHCLLSIVVPVFSDLILILSSAFNTTTAVRADEEEDQDALEIASKYDLTARSAATDASVKAHVCVPTQDDIGAIVVDEKKRLLLEKFSMM